MSTPSAADEPLSAALRAGTREQHGAAERMPFMEALVAGHLDRSAYTALAVQQLSVYRALEAVSDRVVGDLLGSTLVFPELTRVPAIEQDLAYLLGQDWADHVTPLPATVAYVARLDEIDDSVPHYAAHAYTRYLGDLSGGQILRRMMQRHYGFEDDGVAFYDFPQIHRLKPFKDVYRERLDALPFDAGTRTVVVEEARLAFELNRAMFADLGLQHPAGG
ncbi:biliverdin-producing heme oxygenase [Cellulomonas soli]|uniref:Biliverdin-producing heme oxygenase n=1 Tax=Cellulomonas soli TaxID=931535 RepID=A0A512PHV9_9CELL|nr:biliverdin-producing heme oxygenase [Cellulomonas soli]NYI58819.1 heme oxygenase [Cellulomonas soli]GEP70801.1 biliverdin-producing heme oxygenase [Cellulomonas soli]